VPEILLLGSQYWPEQVTDPIREHVGPRRATDPAVVAALRSVPRELFVSEGDHLRAYEDHPLQIGFGQTISQPSLVGVMTELLNLKESHRVLEIGTGSGYQAAILSRLVTHVYTLEVVPELARSAAQRLARLGFLNITVAEGDGYSGYPQEAPFDRIILTAAPPAIPEVLIDQLKPTGILVAPVGVDTQNLVVVNKTDGGQIKTQPVMRVSFVPMTPTTEGYRK
jgi:protein-L-isoaspartate(D-aspartate) O-methyltransferase